MHPAELEAKCAMIDHGNLLPGRVERLSGPTPTEVVFEVPLSEQVKYAQDWLRGMCDEEPELWALAHTVNGYRRAGDAGEASNKWVEARLPKLQRKETAAQFPTQELLDLLFLFCRKERFCEGTLESLNAEIDTIRSVLRDRATALKRNQDSR